MKNKNFQTAVVDWFIPIARELPWRKTSDPYRIWISETMLQQTQVNTVIPYFERFVRRFPTVQVLAEAQEDEVIQLWEGLGYYRRARNILSAAQMIVKEFEGKFPSSKEDLLSLPGIGAYSAGAILSIAFRKPNAALDGNLVRVYARFFGIRSPVDDSKTLKKLWSIAEQMTPESSTQIREFTEGMMELGALVCTPKNPKCLLCPLRSGCLAYQKNWTAKIPLKKNKQKRLKLAEVVYLVQKNDQIGFLKKGEDPKFPFFMRMPFASLGDQSITPKSYDAKLKYSVTFRDFEVFVQKKTSIPKAQSKNIVWISTNKLKSILLPAIDRKILKLFGV